MKDIAKSRYVFFASVTFLLRNIIVTPYIAKKLNVSKMIRIIFDTKGILKLRCIIRDTYHA